MEFPRLLKIITPANMAKTFASLAAGGLLCVGVDKAMRAEDSREAFVAQQHAELAEELEAAPGRFEPRPTLVDSSVPTAVQMDALHAAYVSAQEQAFEDVSELRKVGSDVCFALGDLKKLPKGFDILDPLGSAFPGVPTENFGALISAAKKIGGLEPHVLIVVTGNRAGCSFTPKGANDRKNILGITAVEAKNLGGDMARLKSADGEVAAAEAARIVKSNPAFFGIKKIPSSSQIAARGDNFTLAGESGETGRVFAYPADKPFPKR